MLKLAAQLDRATEERPASNITVTDYHKSIVQVSLVRNAADVEHKRRIMLNLMKKNISSVNYYENREYSLKIECRTDTSALNYIAVCRRTERSFHKFENKTASSFKEDQTS
ncbi:Hypothetical predicted protein [Octopus vulgaris]|uniref:Uncharacterized protein n=1 Tax=Octopus vulgaris TaxID=6645 RepID=A0AA36BMH1_OCTVU|nr:Hypothetical predicted protein [Octopus vulgaris]